jgi:hypothetical protein
MFLFKILKAGDRVMNKSAEKKEFKTLSVKINPELIRLLESKTNRPGIDESILIKRCIQTSLQLGEIDSIFRKKLVVDLALQKQLDDAYGDRAKISNMVSENLQRLRELSDEDSTKGEDKSAFDSEGEYKVLKVRVDQDFYDEISSASDKLGIEISSFVRFCIRTGLYLEDLNVYLQMRSREDK